jgi:pilus assembly protein Flp/PilA
MLNFRLGMKEKAQGMIEYGLIIVLVAMVLIVVLGLVGSEISTVFSQINSGFHFVNDEDEEQTYEEWAQDCLDYLNTVIDGRTVTHARVADFVDPDGRAGQRCMVRYDTSNIPEPIGEPFYP